MFRYILLTVVIIAILIIVGMIAKSASDTKIEKKTKRSEASVVESYTGIMLLSQVARLLSQYGSVGSVAQPALRSAAKVGKWFGNEEIPESLKKELDELLNEKFVHTANMCLRDSNYKHEPEVLKSFTLIHNRLDNIHSLLVSSDKHQLGVSNFYWESKNQQQLPSLDGD